MVHATLLINSKPGIEEVDGLAGQPSTGEPPNPQDLPLGTFAPFRDPTRFRAGFFIWPGQQTRLVFLETCSGQMKKLLDAAYKAALHFGTSLIDR